MGRHVLALLIVCSGLTFASARAPQANSCRECLASRYWAIDPALWKNPKLEDFPETAALKEMRPDDLAIAFSGGGNRSAAATLGELRGLHYSGWLDKVRYVSAVSGGSWAVVPYIYSPLELGELLGAPELPGEITLAGLADTRTIRGKLGESIVKSSLVPGASLEVGDRLSQSRLKAEYRKLASFAFQRLKGPDGERADKTFSRLLDRIFIKPLVSDLLAKGSSAPPLFSWTDASVADIASINQEIRGAARINPVSFAIAAKNRPFLIALGTIVVKDDKGGFPRLVPVEYTPLYAGARQQFGAGLGGTYVSPFAYDAGQAMFERADAGTNGRTGVIGIGPAGVTSTFSLADVVASSGAAPQLHLLVDTIGGKVDPALRTGAGFFPHYRNIGVRLGQVNTAGATAAMPHGDGGFSDNLGLLPLLARHAKNVVVFVNGLMDHRLETQLPSYFWAVGDPGGGGSKRLNVVFEARRWNELIAGLDSAIATGGPQVYCTRPDDPWKVLGNEAYNVQPYEGLNICWVYVADPDLEKDKAGASKWRAALHPDVRKELFGAIGPDGKRIKGRYEGEFKRFPWFRTFGENVPRVIKMKTRQVNVLANFTSWMVTESSNKFRETFNMTPSPRK